MGKMSRGEFFKYCACLALGGWAYFFPRAMFASGGRAKTGTFERMDFEPSYLALQRSGELRRRGRALWERMRDCDLCPRQCGVNRLKGERGTCRATAELMISSHHPHFGEERPLVGRGGSGTIFFAHCGLRCVFCINWEISHKGQGAVRTISDLGAMMLELQEMGCSNINVVTPTHYLPHILLALDEAASRGLKLPLVYNTCGYEKLDILKLLDGVVDIYLPDFKYWSSEMADKYSARAKQYPEMVQAALLEMQRQVGVAKAGPHGLVRRGLMLRHLVMPNDVSGSQQVIEWIAANLPKDTCLNVMSQYRPMHRAFEYPEIAREVRAEEYLRVVRRAKELGLTNLDIQDRVLAAVS